MTNLKNQILQSALHQCTDFTTTGLSYKLSKSKTFRGNPRHNMIFLQAGGLILVYQDTPAKPVWSLGATGSSPLPQYDASVTWYQ